MIIKKIQINRIMRAMTLALIAVAFATVFCACNGNGVRSQKEKPVIVATLFPQYDFARAVVGDRMDVTLLLPPGVESHSYDLTPADMIKIKNSDMFIYTGKYMEAWAATIINSLDDSVTVLDVSEGITLAKDEHEHHHHDEQHDDHDGEILFGGAHDDHHHEYDPHIWTCPVNAITMVNNILESVCLMDPDNSAFYRANATNYISELEKIDEAFRDISENADEKCIFFGGKFAMTYFVREYGFSYMSAYPDCSAEGEPAISDVLELIDEMKEHDSHSVFYEELVDPKIARTIAEETGSQMYLLHSAHNVSKDELESGVTYADIMWGNVERLKEATR